MGAVVITKLGLLKSDLRGIETYLVYIDLTLPLTLKSDLRGIETYINIGNRKFKFWSLKSDLRGIETQIA